VERLAVVETLLVGGPEAMDGDRVAESGEATVETPGLTLHPVHLRVEAQVVARLHHLFAAEPAAESAGAAGVRTQRVALDQQRLFRRHRLGGTVVGIAVIHGDGGVAAVAVVLGAPAAADQAAEIDVEAVVPGTTPVDATDNEISVVAGDDAVRDGR